MEKSKKKLITINLSVITDRISAAKDSIKNKAIEGRDKAFSKAIEKAELLSQKQLELIQSAKKNHA